MQDTLAQSSVLKYEVLFEHASKMDISQKKIRHILQIFFDKAENAALKLFFYYLATVIANHAQVRPIVENLMDRISNCESLDG